MNPELGKTLDYKHPKSYMVNISQPLELFTQNQINPPLSLKCQLLWGSATAPSKPVQPQQGRGHKRNHHIVIIK